MGASDPGAVGGKREQDVIGCLGNLAAGRSAFSVSNDLGENKGKERGKGRITDEIGTGCWGKDPGAQDGGVDGFDRREVGERIIFE